MSHLFEIMMVTLNVTQIGLLCYTMQLIFVQQKDIYDLCADPATQEMPLDYQKFQVWLVVEAGMIAAIILSNCLFLFLRSFFH
jgi:hypothetical protein